MPVVLIDLFGGLSESADSTKLVVTGSGSRFYVINPLTGLIVANGTGAFAGGAGAAGERSVSYFSNALLDFFNSNEQKVRTITSPVQINAIGMALVDDRGRLTGVDPWSNRIECLDGVSRCLYSNGHCAFSKFRFRKAARQRSDWQLKCSRCQLGRSAFVCVGRGHWRH